MRYIAHRALIDGPNESAENHPDQILYALSLGWDVEIDVWYHEDQFWLGHDRPTYLTDAKFLSKSRMWIHCKNFSALSYYNNLGFRGKIFKKNYFWHNTDDFTLTSKGHIWTYPGKELTKNSILIQPEWFFNWQENVIHADCFGICSKYVRRIKEYRENERRR